MRSKPNSMSLQSSWCYWASIAAILLCGGCRSRVEKDWETASIRGSVTVDGKPLEDGTIRFVPTGVTLGPKTTFEIHAGAFQADAEHGPSVGNHRIEIEYADDQQLAFDDEQALAELKGKRMKRGAYPILPAIYNTQSRLTATVEAEMQPLEFSLRSK